MTSWFYFMALGISLFFVVAILLIFVCSFIIYYRVEDSVVDNDQVGEVDE